MVIKGHQWSSMVIKGHQWSSMVINGHQWSSMVINGHQGSSMVIKDHQGSSRVIKGHQGRSHLPRGKGGGEATAVRVEQREIVMEILYPRIRLLGALVPDEGGHQRPPIAISGDSWYQWWGQRESGLYSCSAFHGHQRPSVAIRGSYSCSARSRSSLDARRRCSAVASLNSAWGDASPPRLPRSALSCWSRATAREKSVTAASRSPCWLLRLPKLRIAYLMREALRADEAGHQSSVG